MKKYFVYILSLIMFLLGCSESKENSLTSEELVDIGVRIINGYSTLSNTGNSMTNENLEDVLIHYGNRWPDLKRNDSIPNNQGVGYRYTTTDSITFGYYVFHSKDTLQFSISISAPLFVGKKEPLCLMDSLLNKASDLSLIGTYRDLYEYPELTYYVRGGNSHPMYYTEWGTGCGIGAIYSPEIEKGMYKELRQYCKRYNRM